MKAILSIALLAAATSAGAITVETTDFIASPLAQNGFEGLGSTQTFAGTGGYTEQGITVTYVGSSGIIWSDSQPTPDGLYSWYPTGGSSGYTQVTFGGTVTAVEFLAGSGWFGGTATLYYDVLLGGVSQATGIAGTVANYPNGFAFYGFSGGSFDEIRLQVRTDGGADFGATAFEAGAFDAFQIGEATGGIPEPATWALMIAGFGMVGAAARRRTTRVIA